MLTIYFDGLCEPRNPGGYACYGWLITRNGKALATGNGLVAKGKGVTNNLAEYHALIEALKATNDLVSDSEAIEVRGDSQLVVNQVNGDWKCNAPHLVTLRDEARRLLAALGNVRLSWIPRAENERADNLSREAYHAACASGR